jgi:hypothetical protein
MDDFSVSSLTESKNEWCARLLNILTPSVTQGLKSIFDEAVKLCKDNNENDKYLMTFQNFLTRVPKWNQTIIDAERDRIIETSGCSYLEDLVTCVHIIQLKALTCVRVGSKQKKIDINIPSVSDFIHKIYIYIARKMYMNIYLFEKNIQPLQVQKNNRELEFIVKECILNTVRDSVPVEHILRSYMDETEEQDVEVKEVEEPLPDAEVPPVKEETTSTTPISENKKNSEASMTPTTTAITPLTKATIEEYKQTTDFVNNQTGKLSFSDNDKVLDETGKESIVTVSKDDENLEKLEKERNSSNFNKGTDDDDDNDESERLVIGENVKLDVIDVNDLNKSSTVELAPPILDFEILT